MKCHQGRFLLHLVVLCFFQSISAQTTVTYTITQAKTDATAYKRTAELVITLI